MEIDINDIWNQEEHKSKIFYEEIEPDLNTLVRQRSSDLLMKIKRNVWIEILVSTIVAPFLLLIRKDIPNYGFLVAFILLVGIVILFPYVSFFQQSKTNSN